MKRVLLSFFLFTTIFHLMATESVVINEGMFTIDHAKALILCNQNVEELNEQYPGNKNSFFLGDYYDSDYLFSELNIGIAYQVRNRITRKPYTLYFTQLPVINIVCAKEIPDEPRIYAQFVMQESNGRKISSNIGIELRGNLSQSFPKKSYRIEFWSDTIGNNTKDYTLLGMRSDDDWNLQAMYNEPFKFSNKTSFELWRKIHTPFYISSEPNAINGVRMEYAELFLNGNYMGVFGVGERIDRKQLKLKKHNGEIRGELYKGHANERGPLFEGPVPLFTNGAEVWYSFEYEYPDEIPAYWNNLHDLISFVVDQPDDYFYTHYQSKFEINNIIDYYLFVNLIRGFDNMANNTYIAKYDANTPYFYAPWDLDAVFGNYIEGTFWDVRDGIMSNGLYDRLWNDCSPDGFRQKMRERWNVLRSGVITRDNIMSMFRENFEYLKKNGIYEREAIAWPESHAYDEFLLFSKSRWLEKRIEYLDAIFNEDCPTAISENEKPLFTLYPNPVSNQLTIIMPEDCHSMMFTLFDMQGKEIIKREISTNSAISLEQLPSGFYLYKISSNQHHQMGKIVKE